MGEGTEAEKKPEEGFVLVCDNPHPHVTDSKNHREGQKCTGDDGRCGYTLKRKKD